MEYVIFTLGVVLLFGAFVGLSYAIPWLFNEVRDAHYVRQIKKMRKGQRSRWRLSKFDEAKWSKDESLRKDRNVTKSAALVQSERSRVSNAVIRRRKLQ